LPSSDLHGLHPEERSSKILLMLVSYYITTWHHNPEDHDINSGDIISWRNGFKSPLCHNALEINWLHSLQVLFSVQKQPKRS